MLDMPRPKGHSWYPWGFRVGVRFHCFFLLAFGCGSASFATWRCI